MSTEADCLNRRHWAVVLDTLMCNLSIAVVVGFFDWMVLHAWHYLLVNFPI